MSESTNSTPVFKEEYQKQIADIYKQYQQTVKPYVAQLEVMENEFPIEILNEVRAIMSHIAKCYEITNEELIQKNIGKAKSHMKRCVRIAISICALRTVIIMKILYINIALQI